MRGPDLLPLAVGVVAWCLVCILVVVSYSHAENRVSTEKMVEILDDCAKPPKARKPSALVVVPLIGTLADKAADRAVGGPSRRMRDASVERDSCIRERLTALDRENEREEELAQRQRAQWCEANRCANEEWENYCNLHRPTGSPTLVCDVKKMTGVQGWD